MADDDEQLEQALDLNVSRSRTGWLRNCDLKVFDDGVVSWGHFQRPDFPPEPGDLEYTVSSGERPDHVAQKFYGESDLWWVICVANDIEIPIVGIRPGRTLRIPDPDTVMERVNSEGKV